MMRLAIVLTALAIIVVSLEPDRIVIMGDAIERIYSEKKSPAAPISGTQNGLYNGGGRYCVASNVAAAEGSFTCSAPQ